MIRVDELAERAGLGGFPPQTRIFCGDSRSLRPLSRGGLEWPRGMRLSVVWGGKPPTPPVYLRSDLREEALEVFGGDFFGDVGGELLEEAAGVGGHAHDLLPA